MPHPQPVFVPTCAQVIELTEGYLREISNSAWSRTHPLEVVQSLGLSDRKRRTVNARETRKTQGSRSLRPVLSPAARVADQMLREVEVLNPQYRKCLELRGTGLTVRELADAIEVSRNTASLLLEGAVSAARMFLMKR